MSVHVHGGKKRSVINRGCKPKRGTGDLDRGMKTVGEGELSR